jgi:dTDP-4-dehydrorhamnose reductase
MIIGITGGRGMLGSDIKKLAEKEGFSTSIYDLPEFDLTKQEDIEKMVSECDLIVNCAAYTAVDKAEEVPELAEAVNATAVAKLAESAKLAGKYLLHISTDFVFGDDSDTPMNEDYPTNPLSVYGATKLHGEELLVNSECRHAIIRIQWTYGTNGNHFISKIAELAEKLDQLTVIDDQIGSPTPTEYVAKAVICFIKNKTEGLYHFAAEGYASRYDVAKFIIEELNIKTPITPCLSSEFKTPAQRPKNSRFNCSKIDKVLDFKRPDWQSALKSFLNFSHS